MLTVTPREHVLTCAEISQGYDYLLCRFKSPFDEPSVDVKSIVTIDAVIVEKVDPCVCSKRSAHRGARTHDHKVKSLALYRLS